MSLSAVPRIGIQTEPHIRWANVVQNRPEYCGGIRWDDADLNIDWPLDEVGHMIMSEKDKHNISIREYQELLKK